MIGTVYRCARYRITDLESPGETEPNTTTANQVADHAARLRAAGWTGMLGGTSRPTNPEDELNGKLGRGSRLTGRDEPDPVTSSLA